MVVRVFFFFIKKKEKKLNLNLKKIKVKVLALKCFLFFKFFNLEVCVWRNFIIEVEVCSTFTCLHASMPARLENVEGTGCPLNILILHLKIRPQILEFNVSALSARACMPLC